MSEAPSSIPVLHVVTDDEVLAAPDFSRRTGAALRAAAAMGLAGAVALHLRGPRHSGRALYDAGHRALGLARELGVAVLVNDRVDVALALGAEGVQLGGRSLSVSEVWEMVGNARARGVVAPRPWLVGASVHDVEEALDASGAGGASGGRASFLVLGTIFASTSHPGRSGAGVSAIERVKASVSDLPPVVAIGGITPERVDEVLAAGAHGVAVLGGIWHAPDPARAMGAYLQVLADAGTGASMALESRAD